MAQGYLALVLHAHLPYVRHGEHDHALEENWLFEAITETYIPLFLVLEGLIADGIDFRLTLSVSPTLASMLAEPVLQSRYLKRLDLLLELAAKEEARTQADPVFHPLAAMYGKLLLGVRDAYARRYQSNLVNGFRRFQESGKVELMATAATHGYLPLLSVNESAVRAQVKVGLDHHTHVFGRRPKGFWLPECGYYPGVDAILAEQGVRYTILETHGITRADQRPRYGVYAPIYCPTGVAAFGRDPDSSRQVWSSVDGYPGDYDYREFYRDIGHDLDLGYIGPYIHPEGIRIDTGLKYYRITGKGNHKEPYVPEWAERKAEDHAGHFLTQRQRQVERLAGMMDRKPAIVAPYDAELFGHWWFEGPRWLDYLIRKTVLGQDTVGLVTLSEYLDEFPANQVATPSMSSWGHKGFSEVWLNQRNQWIYPHLHQAAADMDAMIALHAAGSGLPERALNQAGRELLLAQASDWAFMINSGAMEAYAAARTKTHLLRFHRIEEQMAAGKIDAEWLSGVEAEDNVFPEIHAARDFRAARFPRRLAPTAGHAPAEVPGAASKHIVMVCPEVAPFAKTGGLADMVASLAVALEDLGQRVSLILPAYREVFARGIAMEDTGIRLGGTRSEQAEVYAATIGRRIPVYLVRADRYFDREYLYGTPDGDYGDNAERFAFFCRAALELLRDIESPDVLHAHDWQAALAVAYLKSQPERYPGLACTWTAMTVHNVGYQGLFSPDQWPRLGLDNGLFSVDGLEFYGQINFLKGGIQFADVVTTVSPTYAHELRQAEHAFGLQGVFERRAEHVAGILNGADYSVWNPASDPFVARKYSPDDLQGKSACKADLQRAAGLAQEAAVPVVGMVTRLAAQKGLDLVEAVLDELLSRDLQLVILGTGDRGYQDFLRSAAGRHAGRMAVWIAFDEGLAHRIEAGADMFLMPSHYEPSGLNQLYSLKYGTIPIVRATGGLKDSVEEFDAARGTGNGFTFTDYTGPALIEAIDRALAAFRRKECWAALMRNAMAADHSWKRSAGEYMKLYERRTA